MNKYNQNDFNKAISEHLKLTTILMQNEFGKISRIVNVLMKTIKNKGTIFWCGNGGSAGDSGDPMSGIISVTPPNAPPPREPSAFSFILSMIASLRIKTYPPIPTTVRDTTADATARALIIFCMILLCVWDNFDRT